MDQLNTNKKLQKEPKNNKSESKAYSPKKHTPGKTGGGEEGNGKQYRHPETPENAVNSSINQKPHNTSSFLEKLSLPNLA